MGQKLKMPAANCRCGGAAYGPDRRDRKRGYVVRCSKPGCPAMVIRPHAADAVEAWNDMNAIINN